MAESAAVVDVLARVRANTSGFTKGMNDAQKSLNKLSTSSVVKGTIIGNVLFQAASKAARGFGTLLVGAYRDSVNGAKEEASMQMRLERLLLNTAGATREQVQLLHQHAEALEQSTVVSKGNIAVVQSQLATFDLHGSTIAQLTPAILDYVVAEKGATASSDQFKSMTNGLASALNGQFGALARTGFVLSEYDKQMIKTGTENERAAAIVRILGTTYRDFASINGAAATASVRLGKAIEKLKGDFGKAILPVVQRFQSTIADKVIPVFQRLQERFADGKAIEKLVQFFQKLLGNLRDFGGAIITVLEPAFTGLLLPAIKIVVAGIISFIKVLGAVGRFIKKNITFFQVLVGVIAAVAIGTAAYLIQVKLLNAALLLKGKIVKNVTRAFKVLNAVMRLNPIGFIIGAVAALATGFVILWNRSDNFRKMVINLGKVGLLVFGGIIRVVGQFAEALAFIVTGPARALLEVMALFSPAAADARDKLKNMTDGVGEFFDGMAKKVEDSGKALDKFATKKVKAPTVEKPKKASEVDLSLLGNAGKEKRVDEKTRKAAEKLAKQLADNRKALKKAVENYNDFLKNDFANSFMKGAEGASDSVYSALDKLRAVFDAQAKMLSGPALKNLEKAFDKVNKQVRGMIGEYAKVAGMIEDVQDQIDDAYKALEDAIESRRDAMSDFNSMIATPFGEPSEVRKAMAGADASVDSIISQFDSIAKALEKRFAGLAPEGKDILLDYFKSQTQGLIDLARKREGAVRQLQKAQEDLNELLDEQKGFSSDLAKSLKSFAFALIDISKSDSASVYKVTKTATGLIITQTKKSTNAVDTITKNLQTKLKDIVAFSSNINKLIASGLNEEYIRQLLGAGPEAAGETAAALASASTEQLSTINKLYSDINSTATKFSSDMGDKFYNSAIQMAEQFAEGARLGLEDIDTAMNNITTNISNVLGILGDTGLTNAQALVDALVAELTRQANLDSVKNGALGIKNGIATALDLLKGKGSQVAADLTQELYDKLLAEKARLVALAQSIAAAIAAALASAAASIGVTVGDLGPSGNGGGFDAASVRIGEEKDRGGTQEFNRAVTSVAEAASSAVGSAKAATSAIKKTATAVTKSSSTFSKTQLQLVKEGLAAAKTNTVNTTTLAGVMKASVKSPNKVKSTSMPNFRPEATKTKFTGSNTVSKANMPFGGQSVANVTINTRSVPTASQTKAVVQSTLKAASSARK